MLNLGEVASDSGRMVGLGDNSKWSAVGESACVLLHVTKRPGVCGGVCWVFYKFCGLLVSRKENICISLVLVAHF